MRKIVTFSLFFALSLMGNVRDGTADMRGGGPGGDMHGGSVFVPGTEMRGGESRGGGRGFAAGGEIRERGEREEHREFREFREGRRHHRHLEEGGIFIYPGPYYYPSYPDYDFQSPEYDPPEQPGYLYYCENPAGYFPNVVQCPEGWEEVPNGQGG